MNERPGVGKYQEAITIVKRARAGETSETYRLAEIIGPRYPMGVPSLRAIWAAQDMLKSAPGKAAALLVAHANAESDKPYPPALG